jgi:hypothetical protein
MRIVDFVKVFGEEALRTPVRDEFSRALVAASAAHHTTKEVTRSGKYTYIEYAWWRDNHLPGSLYSRTKWIIGGVG